MLIPAIFALSITPFLKSDFFLQNYMIPKWSYLLLILSVTLGAAIVKGARIKLPFTILNLMIVYFVSVVSSLLFGRSVFLSLDTIQVLAAGSILVLAGSVKSTEADLSRTLSSVFRICFGVSIGLSLAGILYSSNYLSSAIGHTQEPFQGVMGNLNLDAEVIALGVVSGVNLMITSMDRRSSFKLFIALSFLLIYLCCILQSRSVLIGLSAALIFFSYRFADSSIRRRLLLLFLISTIGSISTLNLTNLVRPSTYPVVEEPRLTGTQLEKKWSNAARLEIWNSSLLLLNHYPLGIGKGTFADMILPLLDREGNSVGAKTRVETPHNEILRVLLEHGWLFGILILVFICRLVFKIWAAGRSKNSEHLLLQTCCGFFLFIFVQSCFQFPFTNPFTLFLVLLIATISAKIASVVRTESGKESLASMPVWTNRIVFGVLLTAQLYLGSRWLASELLTTVGRNVENSTKIACRLWPDNWQSCLAFSLETMRGGNSDEAMQIAKQILMRTPLNIEIQKYLGVLLLDQGKNVQGCQFLVIAWTIHKPIVEDHLIEKYCAQISFSSQITRDPKLLEDDVKQLLITN